MVFLKFLLTDQDGRDYLRNTVLKAVKDSQKVIKELNALMGEHMSYKAKLDKYETYTLANGQGVRRGDNISWFVKDSDAINLFDD